MGEIYLSEEIGKFKSVKIDSEEFISIIKEFLSDIDITDKILKIKADDSGLIIEFENSGIVEIEIDWNEFVIT
jgi:hypothetical protein